MIVEGIAGTQMKEIIFEVGGKRQTSRNVKNMLGTETWRR